MSDPASTVSITLRAEDGSASLDADSEASVAEFLVQACDAFGLEVDQIDTHCLLLGGTRLLPESTLEESGIDDSTRLSFVPDDKPQGASAVLVKQAKAFGCTPSTCHCGTRITSYNCGWELDERVRVLKGSAKGHVGTVRAITKIASSVWIGLEMDDPVGKHDGRSAKGIYYFHCPRKHGLYIRAGKGCLCSWTSDEEDMSKLLEADVGRVHSGFSKVGFI